MSARKTVGASISGFTSPNWKLMSFSLDGEDLFCTLENKNDAEEQVSWEVDVNSLKVSSNGKFSMSIRCAGELADGTRPQAVVSCSKSAWKKGTS